MRQKIQICEIKGFVGIFRKNEITQILLKLAELGLGRNISTSVPRAFLFSQGKALATKLATFTIQAYFKRIHEESSEHYIDDNMSNISLRH